MMIIYYNMIYSDVFVEDDYVLQFPLVAYYIPAVEASFSLFRSLQHSSLAPNIISCISNWRCS